MKRILLLPLLLLLNTVASAKDSALILSYSDGTTDAVGVDKVNAVLRTVGVRVSKLVLPEKSLPLLEISQKRALDKAETAKLLTLFPLHRGELLEQIRLAGRKPESHRGGYLVTSEIGVAPYPKVYDMKALNPEVKAMLQNKFGKLHVNSSENGQGIDEVMSIVSGGPWTWFFLLPDNVVGKLTLGHVGLNGNGWRISYPGLGLHGGYLDAEYGLVVAYAHGPKNFVMRYEEPSITGEKLLGKNPWIDFSGKTPKLKKVIPAAQ